MTRASKNLQFAIFFVLYFTCACISVSSARNITNSKLPKNDQSRRNLSIRAVNLGGWLLAEGWMTPSLFDGIPNKDLLDGNQVQFKSASVGKYMCAESGGGDMVVANRYLPSGWETFTLWRLRDTVFYLRAFNKQFLGVNSDGAIVATQNTPSLANQFLIERNPDDPTRVKIMAYNGRYIQVKTEWLIMADSKGDAGWGDDDPCIFQLSIASTFQGEYQVTNGYGPVKAAQVMREHWDTYIVEKDFKFMSRNGLNAVRIPIGWWTASDSPPPAPFVSGSLQILDKAFLWARKYGMKVIIDLHAAPGAQNYWIHCGSRDGSQSWGETDESIQQTVAAIEFLTIRYAKHPNLYAIELLNQPVDPIVPLETLKKYYKAAYDVVRKHTKTTYVMLSTRLNEKRITNETELIPFASELERVIIDVHYYNRLPNTVEENIEIIKKDRAKQLSKLITPNGPPIFVGEWAGVWEAQNATKADYQRYVKVQQEVYGKGTIGWAYWNYKCDQINYFSLEWMIKNGYIKIN